MKPTIRLLALLLVGLFAAAGVHENVQAQTADQVYERLKARYKSIQSVRAEFTQTTTSDYDDGAATTRGVLLMQGNKYRVETGDQTLVTDGKVTWVYVPRDRQVLVNDYVEDETTFSLNDFFFDYAERYRVTNVSTAQLDGQKHFVLTLVPKAQDTFFTEVVLSMRDRDELVTRLQVQDVNGNRMDFRLANIEVNPPIGAETFTFRPPQGVEVVDLRS